MISISGFSSAVANSVPVKSQDGTISWGTVLPGTNTVILAGAGINVTKNAEGVITISATGLADGSSGSSGIQAASYQLSLVTDVRYDSDSHKFQKKCRTITFYGEVGDEGDWLDVFEAVSHSSEHETETAQ